MNRNKVLIFVCLLLCFFYSKSHAQILGRNSINSLGKSTKQSTGLSLSQSVGQASNTSSQQANNTYYCQGFQQPVSKQLGKQLNFQVYPNPTQNLVNISLNSTENLDISLCDQQGKLIYNAQKKGATSYLINLPELAPGLYQFTIRSEQELFNTKLIIQ